MSESQKQFATWGADVVLDNDKLLERTAQLLAHRVCCGTEHDAANGKLHGYCIVCGVPWPCDFAGKAPVSETRQITEKQFCPECGKPPGQACELKWLKSECPRNAAPQAAGATMNASGAASREGLPAVAAPETTLSATPYSAGTVHSMTGDCPTCGSSVHEENSSAMVQMKLFIVCIEHDERKAVFAVYASHEGDASNKVLGRNNGWSVTKVKEQRSPSIFQIYDSKWYAFEADHHG